MKTIHLLAAFVLTLSLITSVIAEDGKTKKEKPSPRENLKTAVPEMIRLIEKKEFKTFIEQFISPEELKGILKTQTIDELANFLKNNKAKTTNLLKALKFVDHKKLKSNKKGDRANYILSEQESKQVVGQDLIGFIKMGKYWYIMDRAKKIED